MSTTRYKDLVVLLLAAFIVLLVVDRCNSDKKHAESYTNKDNVIAELEADRMFRMDSIDALKEQLEAERMALTNRLNGYNSLPVKERVKLITKIDTLVVITDTSVTLSIAGIDSINKLTIHYESCMAQSLIKDTIITHLTNVVQTDSVIISSQQKSMKFHKKTAKIKLIKAAVGSFLVGVIFGLVI